MVGGTFRCVVGATLTGANLSGANLDWRKPQRRESDRS
jgi:uncharacterized protein YjbI with pentapeptide repeats